MKFVDAPKDVQKAVRLYRSRQRTALVWPADGEIWWDDGDHCEMCGCDKDRHLVTDHCHETGIVRGTLCHTCNSTEGHSAQPVWEFWRLHAPGFEHREVYYNSFAGRYDEAEHLTDDEVMSLPVADLLALSRERRWQHNQAGDAEAARVIGNFLFGDAS